MALKIEFEWIDPAETRGPELRATWASLRISVDGQPITRVYDSRSRSVRENIFVPCYPLAEWLATHWWFLHYEVETPGNSSRAGLLNRHNLRSGREGFAIPSLSIWPVGETLQLEWHPTRPEHEAVEFISSGLAHVSLDEFDSEMTTFITAVIERLVEFDVTETLLQSEWEQIQNVGTEEREFCIAAASLGLDPYTLSEDEQESIISIAAVVPEEISLEFFRAAELRSLKAQAQELVDALADVHANQGELLPLRQVRNGVNDSWKGHTLPWLQGYAFAQDLRKYLGLNGQALRSLHDIAEAFDVPKDEVTKAVIEREFSETFTAVVASNSNGSPGFLINSGPRETYIHGRSFAFCRGLFEYLSEPRDDAVGLVTQSRSAQQKRNRAFAAEFLAPAAAIRSRLSGELVSGEEIDAVAFDFGVSSEVVRHQVENHRLARIVH
jgi:hypothetical protein